MDVICASNDTVCKELISGNTAGHNMIILNTEDGPKLVVVNAEPRSVDKVKKCVVYETKPDIVKCGYVVEPGATFGNEDDDNLRQIDRSPNSNDKIISKTNELNSEKFQTSPEENVDNESDQKVSITVAKLSLQKNGKPDIMNWKISTKSFEVKNEYLDKDKTDKTNNVVVNQLAMMNLPNIVLENVPRTTSINSSKPDVVISEIMQTPDSTNNLSRQEQSIVKIDNVKSVPTLASPVKDLQIVVNDSQPLIINNQSPMQVSQLLMIDCANNGPEGRKENIPQISFGTREAIPALPEQALENESRIVATGSEKIPVQVNERSQSSVIKPFNSNENLHETGLLNVSKPEYEYAHEKLIFKDFIEHCQPVENCTNSTTSELHATDNFNNKSDLNNLKIPKTINIKDLPKEVSDLENTKQREVSKISENSVMLNLLKGENSANEENSASSEVQNEGNLTDVVIKISDCSPKPIFRRKKGKGRRGNKDNNKRSSFCLPVILEEEEEEVNGKIKDCDNSDCGVLNAKETDIRAIDILVVTNQRNQDTQEDHEIDRLKVDDIILQKEITVSGEIILRDTMCNYEIIPTLPFNKSNADCVSSDSNTRDQEEHEDVIKNSNHETFDNDAKDSEDYKGQRTAVTTTNTEYTTKNIVSDVNQSTAGADRVLNYLKESLTTLFIQATNNNSEVNASTLEKLACEAFTKLYGKELLAQEQKYRQQVDELSRKLAEKQQEVSDLVEELEEAKDATQRKTSSTEQYEIKIEELKRQIREEEAKTESVRVELHFTKNESEITKAKMRRLEEELSKSKELSNSLQDDNEARGRDVTRLKELEVKVKSLEDSLRKTECSRKDMEESLAEVEAERDEELKIVQDALDEAAQEREELILTFQKELDQLNTNNTAREQQMLEDFEWKIHEMEKEHKQRIGEKERHAEERFQTIRSLVETELADSITKIAEDRRVADDTLAEVGHLKSYEAEVIQLRGVTHEFQKALRASAREMENMRIRERILDDEIRTLKKSAQSRQNTLQRVKRQADEEEIRQRLEKMKNEINALWEDRMRSECSRLKTELDELHSEEKHLAVESMKVQKEQEIQMLKKSFDLRQEEMANDISSLKDSLADKDAYYNKKLDTQRTMSERDLWDLRMKLQKLSESSFDQKQQLEEKYREDIERLRVDYEDRIKELESRLARYDAQIGVDVIAQMEKDHKLQMEHVGEQHQRSMERLREELEAEKFQAVEDARVIISKHHEEIESNLREQLAEVLKSNNQCRDELEAVRFSLSRREEAIRAMEDELEHYQNNKGDLYSSMTSRIPQAASTTSSGISSSQFSLASSNDSHGSRNSQDRYSIPDTGGGYDPQDDSQRNGGLLGKVFGGSWFTPSRSNTRRGSTPLLTKKPYT